MVKSKTAWLDGILDEVGEGMTVTEKMKYWMVA